MESLGFGVESTYTLKACENVPDVQKKELSAYKLLHSGNDLLWGVASLGPHQ